MVFLDEFMEKFPKERDVKNFQKKIPSDFFVERLEEFAEEFLKR